MNSCFVFFCFRFFNMHLNKEKGALAPPITILLKKNTNKITKMTNKKTTKTTKATKIKNINDSTFVLIKI